MPAVIPAHVALRTMLRESVSHAISLNAQLESAVAVKTRTPGAFHGKVDFSQPPWHAPVANAIMDLHALSREMEAWLRLSQGLPRRDRGGSSENTVRALRGVVRLSENAADSSVRGHTRDLGKWGWQAEIALGRAEMPQRLPRSPGEPEKPCPWCQSHTLRMYPLGSRGDQVRCVNPGCKDEEGRRPSAQLEHFHGEFVLRWMDGVIGTP